MNKKKWTIHQPEHLVWLGFINKASSVEGFVLLDSVQFKKNNVQNRNRIRSKDTFMWLTVPIKKHSINTLIKDVEIIHDGKWQKKYLTSLKVNYGRAPFFKKYFPKIEKILNKKHKFLVDLNIDLIEFAFSSFGMKSVKLIRSSEIKMSKGVKKSDLVLEICKSVNAKIYLSGVDGKNYINKEGFKKENIDIVFQDFKNPIYEIKDFKYIPNLSFIDYLFIIGNKLPWKK